MHEHTHKQSDPVSFITDIFYTPRLCKISHPRRVRLHDSQPTGLRRHLEQPRGGSFAIRSNLFCMRFVIVPSTEAAVAGRVIPRLSLPFSAASRRFSNLCLSKPAKLFLTTGTAVSSAGGHNTLSGAPDSLTIGGGAPPTCCTAEGIARFWSRWDALIL